VTANEESESDSRPGIIESVKTPLGFFALALLVLEASILAFAAGIDDEGSRFNLLAGCVTVIAVTILVVSVLAFLRPEIFGRMSHGKQLPFVIGSLVCDSFDGYLSNLKKKDIEDATEFVDEIFSHPPSDLTSGDRSFVISVGATIVARLRNKLKAPGGQR
jgi:hypothetical protein